MFLSFSSLSFGILTVGREDDLNQSLVDDLGRCIDQLQDIRTVVVVAEEQQAVRQLTEAVVGELCGRWAA